MTLDLYDAFAPHVLPALIVFSRLGGLFLLAPILGGESVPAKVRVLLALALAVNAAVMAIRASAGRTVYA